MTISDESRCGESRSLLIVKDRRIIDDLGEAIDGISTEILKIVAIAMVVGDKDGLALFDDVVSREVDQLRRPVQPAGPFTLLMERSMESAMSSWPSTRA